jgi:CRP/FNR family cyclic AMP-dependent transcriptional regulator
MPASLPISTHKRPPEGRTIGAGHANAANDVPRRRPRFELPESLGERFSLGFNFEIGDGFMVRKAQSATFDLAAFLATADRGRSMSEHRMGQVIYTQGDAADSVFYIVRGKVKIAVTSGQGREAVVGLFGNGDFFGEGCLIAQPLRLATAIAMADAVVLRIEKAEMVRVLHAETAFAEVFTAHLLSRNSRVEADLVDHLFNSSEKRLARVLLLLANFGKEGKTEPIITKISQETLAEMIGTTRPRVSFFMNKFRRLGFVEYNGEIKVHGSLLSVLLHE